MLLYHFPNESPEDLLRKEGERLRKEIENAKRVEKHGYRRKEPSLGSFFINWHCIHKYLRCPIKKWSWPTCSDDKVELEPLPTDFLPPMFMQLKPLKFFDPELNENIRRIVGFREIQKKREYIEYLKEVEMTLKDEDDGDENGGDLRIEMELEEINVEAGIKNDETFERQEAEDELLMNEGILYKSKPHIRIARGGGKNDKKGDKKPANDKDKEKDKSKKKGATDKGKDKRKDKKDKKKDGKDDKKAEEKGTGFFSKIWSYFTGHEDDDDKGKGKGKGKDKGKEKDKGKDKKEKKDDKDKTKKKGSEDEVKSRAWGISLLWRDIDKQKLEKENQENLEKIYKYHTMFRVKAAKERDSEWLELSNTDPEEMEREIKSFQKPLADWMKEGISFESQCLARSLRLYTFFATITGRSFMKIKADHEKGHMDFTHKKKNIILFFLTSIFFWICFCLIVISFLEIKAANQAQSGTKKSNNKENLRAKGIVVNLEELLTEANQAEHEVEELQLDLYEVPLYVLIINLVLAAIWSILVILGDGIYITHYCNCWCAALAEMETSGSLGIHKMIIKQHVFFFLYACLMVTLFYLNYPEHIRQSNLLICALILRPIKPSLRIQPDEDILAYQIIGMIFQIYVVYCTTLIKLFMAILATVLKNASEMWNFKFALTFQQLASKNRGQLLRLGLNHSLLKLFTHHRILTVLLRNFGEVFSIPIMMYMMMEMGVLTIACVRWFFYKSDEVEKAYTSQYIIIETKTTIPPVTERIRIPYYHSKAEVHTILYLMMVQLLTQFLVTTDILALAGDSFFAGYEFVRRCGTMLCSNSHQRRLIQSLEWSFSSTNPSVLSANSFYTINRSTILTAFAAVAGFFSLFIQLQVSPVYQEIEFNTIEDCEQHGQELYRGTCVIKKTVAQADTSLEFRPLGST